MGVSETIIAATIGAAATLTTALFQLFSAIKANNRSDARPKRGNTARSIVAVTVLMIVSAVGGFVFAELRNERTAQDMHSMRDELNAKLQVLAATTEKLAANRNEAHGDVVAAVHSESARPATPLATEAAAITESAIYAPACVSTACTEDTAQSVALCGAVPAQVVVEKLELSIGSAATGDPQIPTAVELNQDVGGAKFLGAVNEYPQGVERKAVCVNFKHWSSQPHIARLIIHYGSSNAHTSALQSAATTDAAPVATSPLSVAHTVSVVAPAALR